MRVISQKTSIPLPFLLNVGLVFGQKELGLVVFTKWGPVAANDTVVGDDRLEDAAVVVCLVAMVGGKDDVAALVTDEVFVVGRNQ